MTDLHITPCTPITLMAHLVAGFPNDNYALKIAQALIDGGASILEIQLPFSDPSADGEAIQTACAEVLRQRYTTDDGINLISQIKQANPTIPIVVMTYASLCYTPGIANFTRRIASAGVSGVIIPDLPFDCDEGLTDECRRNNIINIPVIAPTISKNRLSKLKDMKFPCIYAALRAGITGESTEINQDTINFIKNASEFGTKILGGFGISSGSQAKMLSSLVSVVVAGSVFVRLINTHDNIDTICDNIRKKAKELSGKEC